MSDSQLDVKRSLVYRPTEGLHPNPKNPNQHSAKQLRQLVKSIKAFGFNTPIIIDKNSQIVAGHGRWRAAGQLGLREVPTICLDDLGPAQLRAFMLADNKLAQHSTWNDQLLAEHLRALSSIELDFDLDATGFEPAEIDLTIEAHVGKVARACEDAPVPCLSSSAPVSKPGDIWALGPHRMLCGNALEPESYELLLEGESADVVFTDPPYNVPIAGHASGLGRTQHRDFVMACGEMSAEGFTTFLATGCGHMARHSRAGAIHFVCIDWRHVLELLLAGQRVGLELKNLCVWTKTNAGMGSFYRSQHELILVFKSGSAPHLNNVQLGRHGRNRTNVWSYPGAAMPARGDEEGGLLEIHPTVKPVILVADALMDCSPRQGIVLDPFCGSGTTLIAAERTGRRARVMEMDPRYVDAAVRRWQAFTRQAAVHAGTGQAFSADEK